MCPPTQTNFSRLNKEQPSLSQMLEDLAAPSSEQPHGQLPEHVLQNLYGFKDTSWKPLCSMVHGGALALHTHAVEFPDKKLEIAIKHSNAVSCLTANLLTAITSDRAFDDYTAKLHMSFPDCLILPETA
ncbi:DUF6988 family protein [Microbulbifer sp. MCCC 1A16149]|uniref:DUF6988 family protein n=1 Tax=Microbulbifer sp. MCCC 1A16149 TaxID=3411322 RepID=UPI003D10D7E6